MLENLTDRVHTENVPTGWLTVKQAAERKGLHEQQIRNAIYGGTLPAEQVGGIWLIRLQDVDNWQHRSAGRPRSKRRGRPPNR